MAAYSKWAFWIGFFAAVIGSIVAFLMKPVDPY
jgi:hypothetical protein